ncbi:MAG TPA: SCO family protein [Usitatibacter sp.]|jgi:protein SCO1/2|nr:SCO family protein [Usitatibacter sp.]
MSAGRGLAFAAAVFLTALGARAHAHGPDPAEGVAFEPRLGARLPMRLAFTDEAGRDLPLGQVLDGKPAVLVMGYLACKDLCPTTLAGVTQALDASGLAPGRDYRALFVSIDPRESAADLLREKDARIAAASRGAWAFLRGDPPAVARLASAEGFRYRYEPGHDAFAHPAGFTVITPDGVVSRDFPGVRFDPQAVATALREAGQGDVGPPASPLLLLCYHFDPATGRYTLRILDILNVAIAVFLAGAAAWAWRLRVRRRRP